jgi:hypothetical protein
MQARMRRQGYLSAAVAVALVVIAGGKARAQASDPQAGTWKENMSKSKYNPASLTPKTGNTKREVAGSGYKTTTDGIDAKGAPTHTESTANLDGKDYPLTGSADRDSVSYKKIDANTLIEVDKKAGAVTRMLRIVVSKDGKTRTVDSVGYNAQGVAFHNTAVYERQ